MTQGTKEKLKALLEARAISKGGKTNRDFTVMSGKVANLLEEAGKLKDQIKRPKAMRAAQEHPGTERGLDMAAGGQSNPRAERQGETLGDSSSTPRVQGLDDAGCVGPCPSGQGCIPRGRVQVLFGRKTLITGD